MEAPTNGFPGLVPMLSEDRLPFSDGIFISPAHLFVKIAAILQKEEEAMQTAIIDYGGQPAFRG